MELTILQELVRELKKSIKAERKVKTLIEKFVEAELLRQKNVFEPHVETVEVPIVGTVNSETGEVKYNKPIEAPDTILKGEVSSPKDVPGYDEEINEQADLTPPN